MTMGFGAYNPWGSSYYGMNSWGMSMNYGYGGYYGYNSGWYQPPVIIIGGGDSNGSGVVYGKRSSRSNDLNNSVTMNNRTTGGTVDTQGRTSRSSGRIASNDNNTSGSYYQRGWRANPETNPNRPTWSNSGRSMNDGSGVNTGNRNSGSFFNESGSRSSGWTGGNSNSSFSSGGSRSGGGTSSGGSSGGARRGRD